MGRAVTIALAASLAANVFLGGYVTGRLTSGSTDKGHIVGPPNMGAPGPGRPPSRMLGEALFLSDSARAAIREAAGPRWEGFRRSREQSLALRREVRDALSAENFDREAAQTALEALWAFHASREQERTDFLLSVFETLPPEERKAVVESFLNSDMRARKLRRKRLEERRRRPAE
ncbi:MAG: periplasmic heavy metal sensor [Pseudomonadota bacterium]